MTFNECVAAYIVELTRTDLAKAIKMREAMRQKELLNQIFSPNGTRSNKVRIPQKEEPAH